eukprot:gene4489-biopygen8692
MRSRGSPCPTSVVDDSVIPAAVEKPAGVGAWRLLGPATRRAAVPAAPRWPVTRVHHLAHSTNLQKVVSHNS